MLSRQARDPGPALLFGVNFADGRIKGYGLMGPDGEKTFFVQCCRGNTGYGINDFKTKTLNRTAIIEQKKNRVTAQLEA